MADPYTTPIPGATGYESATLAAKTAYQNALTRLNQQRGDTLRQFGYAGDIDPNTGVVGNVRVDANLPYGQYQQSRQQHADQYQQAREASQDRGLGHGGLAAHAITRLRSGFGADDASIGQGLSGALSGFQDQQNQSAYSRDSALAEAQLQATRDAIQQQMFNQANLDGLDVPEGPDWGSIITKLLGGDGNDDEQKKDAPPGPAPVSAAAAALAKAKKAAQSSGSKQVGLTDTTSSAKLAAVKAAAAAAKSAPTPAKKKTIPKAKAV